MERVLRVGLGVIALGVGVVATVLLGLQGWNDWHGTVADTYANEGGKTLAFISMIARIAIGLAILGAAAWANWEGNRSAGFEP